MTAHPTPHAHFLSLTPQRAIWGRIWSEFAQSRRASPNRPISTRKCTLSGCGLAYGNTDASSPTSSLAALGRQQRASRSGDGGSVFMRPASIEEMAAVADKDEVRGVCMHGRCTAGRCTAALLHSFSRRVRATNCGCASSLPPAELLVPAHSLLLYTIQSSSTDV
jgi:hypothetical protein